MRIMKHIEMSGLRTIFEHVGRARLRRSLLKYSNRALADMGFSKRSLKAGAGAWPWRLEDEAGVGAVNFDSLKSYRTSANPDQGSSDRHTSGDTALADIDQYRDDPQHTSRDNHHGIDGLDQAAA